DGAGCWSEDVDGDGAPDLDGDYDSDIFIHEYHHGVSNRLNTDFTGDEADAMGEGGSDFFAYSINGNTKLAEFVAPPDGIRQVNAKTYADWACYDFFFFFICEPHDNGEISANTLWDMREQFRAGLGKGSEAAAVHEGHPLHLDRLTPATVTFTRNGSTDAALVVGYTVAGSAPPGSDYVRLSGTVTIPAGAADATVILTPLDDPLVEGDETVEVDLRASSAYVIGS